MCYCQLLILVKSCCAPQWVSFVTDQAQSLKNLKMGGLMLKLTVLYLIFTTFLFYYPFQIFLTANPYSGLHFSLGGIIKLSSVRCESLVTLLLLEHSCFIFTITHGSIKESLSDSPEFQTDPSYIPIFLWYSGPIFLTAISFLPTFISVWGTQN